MGKGNDGFCFGNTGLEMLVEHSAERWNMQ